MGHPLTSETGKSIQNWILYPGILKYTDFVFRWDPMQFGSHMHLQKYVENDGSVAYLKSNTVKQIVGLKKYICMLSDQDRPAPQKNNHLYHISGNQLFILTACDMRTAFVNEKLENQKSCTTPASPMPHYTSPSSSAPMRSTIIWELTPFKKRLKPDDPPQDVDKSHPVFSPAPLPI